MRPEVRKLARLSVGLVGTGSIGKIHARNIMLMEDLELSAMWTDNRSIEEARKLCDECKVDRLYTSYKEMVDRESLDIVIVACPNYLHSEVAIYSLSKGANVICEKPMAMNAIEAERMVEASKKYKRNLMIAMNHRFASETQTLKKLIEQGELGEIYLAKADWLKRLGIPGMGSWFTTRRYSGGGALMDLGPHIIDLALWFMDFPQPKTAVGYTFSELGIQNRGSGSWGTPVKGGPFDVEDMALGIIGLDGSRVLSVQVSWASYIDEMFNVNVLGNKAGVSYHPPKIITETEDGAAVEKNIFCQKADPYKRELEHFIKAIKGEEQLLTTPEQGLIVMKIIDAIYLSATKGEKVEIRA
jgi:predicted dehydrogenase